MQVRIKILADNNSIDGLGKEHGLSIWIEADGKRILFDTGQSDLFLRNAKEMGVDLSEADLLVLSHGHYDHTGGVASFLSLSPHANVVCHPDVWLDRFSIHDGAVKPIGMPVSAREALKALPGGRLQYLMQPMMISNGIGLTGEIPRHTDFEDTGGPFYLAREKTQADLIHDDLALWVRMRKGLIVLVGCCHAGLINTLDHIQQTNPGERIHGVIGGFHLNAASDERMERTVSALKRYAPAFVAPCHCTGEHATEYLRRYLGSMVANCEGGKEFQFD